jgi:hypothetical protein
MRKFGLTLFAIAIFGWLLALTAPPVMAYYPPLTATATFTYNSVSRTVYDPKLQKNQGLITQWGGQDVQVMDLKQHNGVISWIFRNGTAFFVYYSVYDPYLAKFKEDMRGPFASVSQLQVQDGVVAYVAPEPGAVPGARYATYDPIKGWQHRTWLQMDGFTNLQVVANKDGVVLRRQEIVWISGVALEADIYDAALGQWDTHIVYVDQAPYVLGSYTIDNATVIITRFTGLEWVTETHGYDHSLGDWYLGYTKPLAYFVAQPTSGPPPLWVWFTDMSIAGTTWNWYFGDNSGSTSRSPYHTYHQKGSYWVAQQVNYTAIFARNINVRPAVIVGPLLHLLLQ